MPILDTSVVLAVLLNEPLAERAMRTMRAHAQDDLHGPDILHLEIANALINAMRCRRITEMQVRPLFVQAQRCGITLHRSVGLVARALEISVLHQRRPFDGIFLALAEHLDTQVITADSKLVQGLAGTTWEPRVSLLA